VGSSLVCIKLYVVSVPIKTANIYKILVIKLEGKRPFMRFRHRGESIINMHLKGREYEAIEWINLGQDRIHWLPVVYGVEKHISVQFFLASSPFVWSTS
jgi:hypothetical protein